MSQRSIECELRSIAVGNRGVIVAIRLIERCDCGSDFLGTKYKRYLFADAPRLSEALEILVGRFDGVLDFVLGLFDAIRSPLSPCQRLSDVGGDAILGAKEFNQGDPPLALALAYGGTIAETQVLQLPYGLEIDAVSRPEISDLVVDAARRHRA